MTDEQPKKKRFGFKKAAWQTAPTTGAHEDMFSHSREYKDIIAEETKRKNEEKRKAEEAKQRKAEELRQRKVKEERQIAEEGEQRRKRRRISTEPGEDVPADTSSSPFGDTTRGKGRSKTPMSPAQAGPDPDTLASRYDSLTKLTSKSSGAANQSVVIDLGDTDEDEELPTKASPSPVRSIPLHSKRTTPEDEDDIAEVTSTELSAKARARVAAKARNTPPIAVSSTPTPIATPKKEPKPTAMVQLFIVSELPNTNPLIVKVKTDMTLERAKNAWCEKQGFTPEQTREIFMTWKRRRIWDTTMIQRLGLQVDARGNAVVEGDPTIYDETNLPKIHVEAWTEELFQQRKKDDALEAARATAPKPILKEPTPEPQPQVQAKQIRLILKANHKPDFKIKVHGTTEIGHLADAYKKNMGIPTEQPITLRFDGERLKPMDTIEDADIDDMDSLEVHFK